MGFQKNDDGDLFVKQGLKGLFRLPDVAEDYALERGKRWTRLGMTFREKGRLLCNAEAVISTNCDV